MAQITLATLVMKTFEVFKSITDIVVSLKTSKRPYITENCWQTQTQNNWVARMNLVLICLLCSQSSDVYVHLHSLDKAFAVHMHIY